MHEHAAEETAQEVAAAEPAARTLLFEPTVARVLALQRSAGNAAVTALLARQPAVAVAEPDAFASSGPKEPRAERLDLAYVAIFGTHDLYGSQAKKFVKLAMPDHKLIEPKSMEDLMAKIAADLRSRTKGGKAARISELQIISHANKSGYIKMPLVSGRKGTTVEELNTLQKEFQKGQHTRFQEERLFVLAMMDEGTDVIVRGCRAGRVQALTDALASFFGGQPTIYVSKDFQAFTRMRIGGGVIQDALAAYDFLEARGWIPYGLAYTDDEKKRWVAKNLPDGYVPEMFLVADEDEEAFRTGHADDPALQSKKDYESAALHGLDDWSLGRNERQGDDDDDLDRLSYPELIESAKAALADLRRLENDEPDNWYSIGHAAWMLRRHHKAWLRRPESHERQGAPGDPIGGMRLNIPGLSYDTNLLAMQAARRPDLMVPTSDAFADDVLALADVAAEEGIETIQVEAGPVKPGAKPAAKPGKGGAGGKAKPKDQSVTLPEDTVLPLPGMPEMDPATLGLEGSAPEEYAGKSARVPNFKAKIPVYTNTAEAPSGYFTLKGVEVGLEGYIDWGTKGEQEIAVGQLVSFEKGKPVGIGVKGDVKFKDWQTEGGWTFKWKGGGEIIRSHGTGLGKYEVSTALEVSKGAFVGEAKIFCSYDEKKGELRVVGVKVSPLGVQGEFKIPLKDGAAVTMKGKALLTFDIQPNWAKIAQRLGLRLGAAAGAGAGAGTAIATGFAAVTAAEALVLTGAVAGVAVSLYAYYRAIKDWHDIKAVLPVAEQASADMRAGFCSVFGVGGFKNADPKGAMYAKGVEIGKTTSRKMAENMLEGYKAKFYGQDSGATVEDAEAVTRQLLAESPQLQSALRDYAYGAFHHWVMAEFYREWRHRHKGEWTFDKNDKFARTYLGLPDDEDPPQQPNWTYHGKAEPQVIEEPF